MYKLNQVLNFPKLNIYSVTKTCSEKDQELNGISNYVVGIEVEVEFEKSYNEYFEYYWNNSEDNSLKWNGREFISKPIRIIEAKDALSFLFENINKSNPIFTQRTSIHVHINVRDLTVEQLLLFIMVYFIFEKLLYKFSGGRDNNHFCIPLTDIDFIYWFRNIKSKLQNIDFQNLNLNKYSGLNLIPAFNKKDIKGTFEFRHMAGNNNINLIYNWIKIIGRIKYISKKLDYIDFMEFLKYANTTSSYNWLLKETFGSMSKNLIYPQFHKDIEHNITLLKLALFQKTTAHEKLSGSTKNKINSNIQPTFNAGDFIVTDAGITEHTLTYI